MKRINKPCPVKLFFLALICFLPALALAQTDHKPSFFYSLNSRTGKNVPHRKEIMHLDYPYNGIEFKMGWQTTGTTQWQQAYRYPSLGIGFNWNTFHTNILGNPAAAYAFSSFPLFRLGPLRFDIETNLGLSYGINPYDEVANPLNTAIGSPLNGFFGLYFEQTFFWDKQLQLFVSEGFSHYSNASLGYPNFGLNVPSLKVGVRYHPGVTDLQKTDFAPVTDNWSLVSMLYSGQREMMDKKKYIELALNQSVYYRKRYKNRFGLGYELAYNEARGARSKVQANGVTFGDLITGAVFLTHEFMIERITLLTQIGVYAFNIPADTFYFERIGIGFRVLPKTRLLMNLKAHYFKAEYLEFGIAYDLSK
jgi:hypothetical protein